MARLPNLERDQLKPEDQKYYDEIAKESVRLKKELKAKKGAKGKAKNKENTETMEIIFFSKFIFPPEKLISIY